MSCRSFALGRIVPRKSLVPPPAVHCPWIALKFFITCTFCAAIGQRQKIAQRQLAYLHTMVDEFGAGGRGGGRDPRREGRLHVRAISLYRAQLITQA